MNPDPFSLDKLETYFLFPLPPRLPENPPELFPDRFPFEEGPFVRGLWILGGEEDEIRGGEKLGLDEILGGDGLEYEGDGVLKLDIGVLDCGI